MRELPFYTNWSYAHPRAIELADEVASLAPGDLNRVFFVSGGLGGGGVGVEARPPVLPGARPRRTRAATRRSPGASRTTARRSARSRSTASRAIRTPFEPLVPEVRHVSNTNRYHRPPEESEEEFTRVPARRARARRSRRWGRRPCASCTWSPCRTPAARSSPPAGYWQGVREICTEYDILLSADEVITGFGRVGHWFASERYDIRPDIVMLRQGALVLLRGDRRGGRDATASWSRSSRTRRCSRTASRSAATR